ncbi:MAG: tRNA (N6-isopentenyl adenosine(37)-C2)-methylthiotransferase MiaB [Alphaproteobacteria bacterium]|nr:tRNA (N6-isopentenyl adenosine(37)-C2)-methylthiotransferase MiaB [Alphaproteobacteria bacterium]
MTAKQAKKLYIKTWGCQMNVYDSHRMADVLRPLGYEQVEEPEGADMVILNTCHIREKATEKVFSDLGRLRDAKEQKEANGGDKMLIAVAGCVAQAEGEVITSRAPCVDMVFGPQTYHELPEMVAKATGAIAKRAVYADFAAEDKFDKLPEEQASQGVTAFLSIQEGCDKFCTFCVVPYTRGAEYSRSVKSILDEAKRLVDGGAKELTLLGQNVNAFHGEGTDGKIWGLGRLMDELSKMDALERIRYTTSHPRDVQDDLIEAHKNNPKVMPFIHLPVQSGSDAILKAMNRKHTADDYRRIIERFVTARPDIAFSSDFIIGFPGETEQDFEDTLKLATEMPYGSVYSFKYSARPGTPAANMKNLIAEKVKTERLAKFQNAMILKQKSFNESFIGKTVNVLFDRKPEKQKDGQMGHLSGRSQYNQSVHIYLNPEQSEKIYGKILPVMVTEAYPNSLTGELTGKA